MWKYQYSKMYRGITQKEIWALVSKTDSWKNWFKILINSSVASSLKKDELFTLHFLNDTSSSYVVNEVIEGVSFTLSQKFFGATLLDKRLIEETVDGVRLTRTLSISGPLTFYWKRKFLKTVHYKSSIEFDYLVTEARRLFYSHIALQNRQNQKNLI